MSEILSHRVSAGGGQFGSTAAANSVRSTVAYANNVSNIINSPSLCRGVVANGFYLAGTNYHGKRGTNWTDGPVAYCGFNTVLPPNSPSCADGGQWGDQNNMVLPPTSGHTGGVNASMCDGSVRFVSNSIDTGNLGIPQPAGGLSVYGAWGALGSISGGEVSSLGE